MKRKLITLLLFLCCCFCVGGLVACDEKGADGSAGKDGVGVSSAFINEEGELIFTLTDGEEVNAGKLPSTEKETANTTNFVYKLIEDEDESYYEIIGLISGTQSDVVIPSTYKNKPVKVIGERVFEDITWMTSVTIPDSITEIKNRAFVGCTLLEKVYITDITAWCSIKFEDRTSNPLSHSSNVGGTMFLQEIETNLYLHDTLVTELDIPSTVTEIKSHAFSYYDSLTSVTIPNSVTSIGSSAFTHCTSLSEITIPSSVTTIGSGAFSSCDSLTSVTIPSSVTTIGKYAFYECTSLREIAIPSGVTTIGEYAFYECTSLREIAIPSGVTTIGEYAFYGCTNIIQTENGVQYVGKWVVDCDTSVATVTLRADTVGIADYAFSYCHGLTSVTIPDSVTTIGDEAFKYCASLSEITVDENNANYASVDGNLYNKDKTTLIQYAIGKTATSFTIPSTVTTIGEYAFSYCTSLSEIIIPSGVTTIGEYAFYYCTSLSGITIPSGVTTIGSFAFSYCRSLTSVTFENTDGWFVTNDETATSGENIDVTDPAKNATYLQSTYDNYDWKRKVSA